MKRVLVRLVIIAVLAAVFLAYFQPDFVLDIANRIVMCL